MTVNDAPFEFIASMGVVGGVRARHVRVDATTDARLRRPPMPSDPADQDEIPPANALVNAFLEAVAVGCLGGFVPAPEVTSRQSQKLPDGELETWMISLPPVPADGFGVLLRMMQRAATAGNGVTAFSLTEDAPVDLGRVGPKALRALASPNLPFELVNNLRYEDDKSVPVLVTFEHDVTAEVLSAARHLFESWSALLHWGGFHPAPDEEYSSGFVADVSSHLPEEVVAEVEYFVAAKEAWHALAHGLCRLHSLAPIRKVEIG